MTILIESYNHMPAPGPMRKRYEEWFKKLSGRNSAQEAALLEAADAYDAAMKTKKLTSKQLQCIVATASSSPTLLWSNAVEFLTKLSGKFPAAAEAIVAMSRHRQAHVRFVAICALGRQTPEATTDLVLRALLQDKSSKVRWKAAQEANSLERITLIPDMAAALRAETSEESRASIELSLRLLRDGCWLEKKSRGNWTLTVRLPRGLTSVYVTPQQVRKGGVELLAAQIAMDRF